MQSKSAVGRTDSRSTDCLLRSISQTIVGVFAFAALAGCPGSSPPAVPKVVQPHAGTMLKIACSNPAVLTALTARAAGWASRNGVTLKTVSGSGEADVIIATPAQVGEFAANNDALSVPVEMKTLEHPCQWNGILRVYRDQLAAWAAEPCAIPLAGDGAVLVLNLQRLEDPVLNNQYLAKFGKPLPQMPTTWEDLAEISDACAESKQPTAASSLEDFLRVAACADRQVKVIRAGEFASIWILVKINRKVIPPIRVRIVMAADVEREWPKSECGSVNSRCEAVELIESKNWRYRSASRRIVHAESRVYRLKDISIANTKALISRLPRELIPPKCQSAISMIDTFKAEIDLGIRFGFLAG